MTNNPTMTDYFSIPPMVLVVQALDFAAHKHTDQRRKGERAEPYVNHLAEVARLLAEATDGADPALVAAGLLHDTIEDTLTTRDEIAALFGEEIATVVVEVTDDKSLTVSERKQAQILNAPKKSTRGKMVKLADKTSNLRSMVSSPPYGWPLSRQLAYFEWAAAVVAGCRGVNDRLEKAFDDAYQTGLAALQKSTIFSMTDI
ncbi:HD domain-containing protein [Azospirillaceae bacterium]